jgi:cytochrome c-type biogenesis protein
VTRAAIAFSAGLVSFATPCVLPLVPAYLSAIGVRTGDARSALRAGLPFVLGFSAVFVAMGVGVAVVGGRFADYRTDLIHLGGIVIVAMGFVMMGLLRVPALERSMQPALEPAAATGSPLLLGGAFGLCWTPCVGPVLAALLALASSSRTAGSGAALLAAYSAGLAVPFLAAGVAFGKVMGAARSLRDHYATVRVVSGCILVAVGLAMFFDRMYVLNALVNRVAMAV